jgi:hypothetical protein
MKHDLSTLNAAELRKLPITELPARHHLQDDPGNGCVGDPPGYPTYLTRSVYTSNGDTPRRGAEQVIPFEGKLYVTLSADDWRPGDTWDYVHSRYKAIMRRLWNRLPLDHPRVQAWVTSTHQHHQNCYVDDEGIAEKSMIVYSVPGHKLRSFVDDERFSDAWRAKERAAIDAYNVEVRANYARVSTIDNHSAVRLIRAHYPEYSPKPLGEIEARPRPGDWWQRLAERPTASECRPPMWFGAHRKDGWCQFCGYMDPLKGKS